MPRDAKGGITIATIRDLIEEGYRLSGSCDRSAGCGRDLGIDVYDVAEAIGLDWLFVDHRIPIRCAECGCRRIHWIVAPEIRSDSTRAESGRPINRKPGRTFIPPHLDLWRYYPPR